MDVPEGWIVKTTWGFGSTIGPFHQPEGGDGTLCGFLSDERHGNRSGFVHGGMLATAFDVALGNVSWKLGGGRPTATLQLGVHYVGAVKVGEFAAVRVETVRVTRSLIFLRGVMTVADRTVATGEGVWKIIG